MTGRFADLRQQVSAIEEPAEQQAPSVPEQLVVKPSRSKADPEPMRTIQARVPQSVRSNFSKLLIDLQDEFPKEVTQEEGITALLYLVTEQPRWRSQWVKAIKERRQQP